MLVGLVNDVLQIFSENSGKDEVATTLILPVLPKEVAVVMPSSFGQVVILFCSRRKEIVGGSYVDELEKSYRSLYDRRQLELLLEDMWDWMKTVIE